MDPSNDQTAGIQAPVEGQALGSPLPQLDPQALANPASSTVSGQIASSQTPQVAPMTTIPLPLPSSAQPQTTTLTNQAAALQVADDKDVIEPEWVHKAKAIVNSSRDDPYKQSEELTILKADYMQKRYNKIVKLK